MREPVRKVIDQQAYVFHQMPAKASLKLLTRIIKIVGAPIGAGVGSMGGAGDMLEREINLESVVTSLCDRLDENQVERIIDELLSQARHEGEGEVSAPHTFEALFGGNLPHLFKVVMAAFEAEYGNFFGGKPVLQSLAARAGMTLAKQT